MIETRALSVSIGRKPIVHGIDLQAFPGEVTVIVGPNGSGKTTLLKAICGDLAYDGTVMLNGRDVSTMSPRHQAEVRAVLPQATNLAFPFTVREVVGLGTIAGFSGAKDAGRLVDQALMRVDLNGFAGRYYQELSGGEQQRVQLARVLCQVWTPILEGVPRWLLLDEPVSSLDIRHQLTILDIARQYAQGGGGVIAILHDLNLAAMYGDTIVAMRDGQVRAQGKPTDVVVDALMEEVFECPIDVGKLPAKGTPFVLPQSAVRKAPPELA